MPVYTDLDVDYASLGIGNRVRNERKRNGWTLKELGERVSLSIGMLSAIENEKSAINIDVLLAIAEALHVSLDALLPPSAAQQYLISRQAFNSTTPAWPVKLVNPASETSVSYHSSLWPLAQSFFGKYIEPFAIKIEAVSDEHIQFISHHNEEFFFVLSGSVECLLQTPDGLKRERLSAGDCMYFWSYLPHCIRSTNSEPAFAIHVIHSPNETCDSEFASRNALRGVYLIDSSRRNVLRQIANRITLLRQTNGMSLGEFAEIVGISARALKLIEEGSKTLSLELLFQICRIFRKPREYFLPSNIVDRPFSCVLRRARIRRAQVQSADSVGEIVDVFPRATFKALAADFPRRGMEPWLITIDVSGHVAPAITKARQGQEFVYVLDGAVRLVLGTRGKEEILFAGDSCFVDSCLPHYFTRAHARSFDKRPATLIGVSWRPHEISTGAADTGTSASAAVRATVKNEPWAPDKARRPRVAMASQSVRKGE